MKKFEMLGRSLSKGEMKQIMGGQHSQVANCSASCANGSSVSFTNCSGTCSCTDNVGCTCSGSQPLTKPCPKPQQ